MNECDTVEAIDKTILSEQTKFRLDQISFLCHKKYIYIF